MFPCLLAGAFAVVAVLLLLGSIVGSYSREKTSSFILPEKRSLLSVVVILLLLLATPYIMGFLGFLLTAFFFLAVLLLRLRDKPLTIRSALTTILLSAGVTGVVYAVFWWGAKVPLPVGVLLGA